MQSVLTTPFSGITKIWVYARRNDTYYLANKLVSVILAFSLAVYTESLKTDLTHYIEANPDAENGSEYSIIYWCLFIFYAFHAVDELIELYAVYFKREKGALGLLLELNYFLGACITISMISFYNSGRADISDSKYVSIYNWIKYQVIFFYITCGISVLLFIGMWLMNRNLKKSQVAKTVDAEENKTIQ